MSVPVWKRSESDVIFLYNTYKLAKETGQLIHNTARKYRDTYGDKLISLCTDAIYHERTANKIRICSSKMLFEERQLEWDKAVSTIETYAITLDIYTEIITDVDGMSQEMKDKIFKKEHICASFCDDILSEIKAIQRSDRKRFKESIA